jgi:hypothetical protein
MFDSTAVSHTAFEEAMTDVVTWMPKYGSSSRDLAFIKRRMFLPLASRPALTHVVWAGAGAGADYEKTNNS